MPKINPRIKSIDDLLGLDAAEESPIEPTPSVSLPTKNTIITLPPQAIRAFRGHPFRLYEGDRLNDLVESISEHGVLNPAIIRKIERDEDGFEYHHKFLSAQREHDNRCGRKHSLPEPACGRCVPGLLGRNQYDKRRCETGTLQHEAQAGQLCVSGMGGRRYNGMAAAYKTQAINLGFSSAEANVGEGSPYVMNRADKRRDPTVEPTKSNRTWGQIKSDGGSMVYPANTDHGAFVLFKALR